MVMDQWRISFNGNGSMEDFWLRFIQWDGLCVCVCFVNGNGSMVDSFNLWFFYEMVHSMGDLNGNGLGWYAVDDEWMMNGWWMDGEWMVNGWWMVCYDMDIGYLRR